MYANHEYERGNNSLGFSNGDNALERKKIYPIKFDQMSDHRGEKGWENTIRFNNAGVFGHPGDPAWNIGCKALCRSDNFDWSPGYHKTFQGTVDALQDVRDLWNSTDKQGFFYITGFNMPVTPIPKPQSQPVRKGWISFEEEPTLTFPKN